MSVHARVFIVYAGAMLLLATDAHAEGSSPQTESPMPVMALGDAIAYARAHQPAVRAALARVRVQEAAAAVPRARFLPVVAASAQFFGASANNTTGTYVTSRALDIPRIGGTRVTSFGSLRPYASTLAAVGGRQELFDFGRIAAEAAAEDAAVEARHEQAIATLLDVTFNVEEGYFAVASAKAIVAAAQGACERATVHRDLARAGVKAGLRPPVEETRAEADLARFEVERVQAKGGLALAQEVFAALVGAEVAALDVPDSTPGPADLPELATAMRAAAVRDPRIRRLLAELRTQELRARAVGAALRPDLALTATISGRAGGATPSGNGEPALANGFLPTVPNWDVGVVFTWPLFDAEVGAKVDVESAKARMLSEELGAARYAQEASIRESYLAVTVAREALPGLTHMVEAANANYAQADARFRAGLGTSVELADAEGLRAQAEVHLALGQFGLARTRTAFGRAIAEGL